MKTRLKQNDVFFYNRPYCGGIKIGRMKVVRIEERGIVAVEHHPNSKHPEGHQWLVEWAELQYGNAMDAFGDKVLVD